MTILQIACIGLNRLICYVGRAATWMALALMIVIIFDVVSRRFFVLGSTKLQELEWHLHTVLFIFCLGYAFLANAHVRIDLFRSRISNRLQSWIELVGCLCFVIPYCGILVFNGIGFAVESYVSNEVSSAGTGLSDRWIIKSALTIGLGMLMLAGISVALRQFLILFGPAEAEAAIAQSLHRDAGRLADETDAPGH
ncbi:MAG: TRAP transporter small permease subunit [Rhodospirillaceae bacterium]|nr:TRAP transporter small permease subunit [Rhodospirillaceae bacterium]